MNRFAYCPKCHSVFETGWLDPKLEWTYTCECPAPDCDGMVFEIDEDMILPIEILNRKGYETRWCCSGHVFDMEGDDGYISFSNDKNVPETLPDGWYSDEEYKSIRYHISTQNPLLRRKAIVQHIDSLIDWAVGLPQNAD